MPPKDRFSIQSAAYAQYRPHYPSEVYDFLLIHCKGFGSAWDVGTGNGQVASVLSQHFGSVEATDISAAQLEKASKAHNIHYRICPAEATPFEAHSFDLVTAAAAVHWFQHDTFYAEVNRVAKPGALIAVWSYWLLHVNPAVDELIHAFHNETLDAWWDPERRFVAEQYRNLSFPFQEIETPEFGIDSEWTVELLEGYLNTWSSVQNCLRETGKNPVDALLPALRKAWGNKARLPVRFPVFMRAGRVSAL